MFWDNFFDFCQKNNTTPTAVVKELNISSGSITAWKNGRVPKWNTLVRIAEYFNVTPDILVAENTKITDNNVLSNNTINGNYNVVGNNSQISLTEELTKQEQELIAIFRRLSELDKAKYLYQMSETAEKRD